MSDSNRIYKEFVEHYFNSLVLMRVILPIFMAKALIQKLNVIYYFPNNGHYELSLTELNKYLPLDILAFHSTSYFIFKYLIVISACLSIIGFLGRLNLFILAFLGFYLGGTFEGIGIFSHELAVISQIILILTFLPGVIHFSVDQILFKPIKASGYQLKFGTRLILLLFALIYFTAGISKIRYGGLQWLNGSTLKYYLTYTYDDLETGNKQLFIKSLPKSKGENWKGDFTYSAYTYGTVRTSDKIIKLASYIANNKILVRLFSILSILIELLGFIMFINSKYRNFYLISIIGMHIGIYLLMGINFIGFQLVAFCLIDWRQLFCSIEAIYLKSKTLKIS